jgi:inosose dehydratase
MNSKKKKIAERLGCFALLEPFTTLDKQVDLIKSWGFSYGDITDSSDGACLGVGFGFTSVASLDDNPFNLKRMFDEAGLGISTVCAHSLLLDPSAPWRYGTSQIIKAVRLAASIGVKHVVTTEGEAHTEFGENLSEDEAVFLIYEKLYEPLKVAKDLGVKILLEPHGPVSDSIRATEKILNICDSDALALNLDTGNLWLGGGDPVEYVKKFGSLIEHVHWKDLPAEMEPDRGKIFGCGMSVIPLGTGAIQIKETLNELVKAGFEGYSTLEIAGEDAVKGSRDYLEKLAMD